MEFSWKNLPKPFTALAPMEDVTDTVFRQTIASIYKPDVMFSEFISVEGLCSKGKKILLQKLSYSPIERPIIVQIWGHTPEYFYTVSKQLVNAGFDGIDINMGCPQRKIIKHGGCGKLITNPHLAKEIIHAVKEGIRSTKKIIPISVKTRIGFDNNATEQWIGFLLKQQIDALTIHARTVKQMSSVPADWNEISKAVKIKEYLRCPTILIGNGDVMSYSQIHEYHSTYHVDGIMIGRGIFTNPWIFHPQQPIRDHHDRINLFIHHATLFQQTYGTSEKFPLLKRFIKTYIRDIDNAISIRNSLMSAKTIQELIDHLIYFQTKNPSN